MIAKRIARRFYASYFNVGDVILWGKYKNHRGKIVAFSQDHWGNPTIEVEPIPKGRKQNKVMGLFKIWRADVKEKAMKELEKTGADHHFFEVWKKTMDEAAKGLDLNDSEDRTAFRLKLQEKMKHLKAFGLKDLIENIGAEKPAGNSNTEAIKALANAYIKGKQIKVAMSITKSIVARYRKQAGIDRGNTYVSAEDNVRIHRYADHFEITDLTNAGKRGKTVEGINVSLSHNFKGDADGWFHRMGIMLPDAGDFHSIQGTIKDLQDDFPDQINVRPFKARGVDVLPATSNPIQLTTNKGVEIKADPFKFLVVSVAKFKGGPKDENGNQKEFDQRTLYSEVSKKDALLFYTWLKDNLAKVNQMDITDLQKVWHSQGIQYDGH